MTTAAPARRENLLLSGAFVGLLVALVGGAAVLLLAATGRVVVDVAAGVLATCGLAMLLSSWLVLRSATAGKARLQLEIVRLQANGRAFATAQNRFVRNLAHEANTPLTIVVTRAELLLRCNADPVAVMEHAKWIADYVRHLAELCEGFLQLTGPIVNNDTSHHGPLHLPDLVVDVVRRSQSMARGLGVGLVATLPEPGNDRGAAEVLGNLVLLQAMLENLVRQALLGSARGSSVEVVLHERDESILLAVRDHGDGIDPAHIESVFDWFGAAPDLTGPPSGPGRGLAIGKRVAEHHRGTLVVRNHPAGGCEVTVQLPRWLGEGPRAVDRGLPTDAAPLARPA